MNKIVIFNKWWLLLAQGFLLVVLSFTQFNSLILNIITVSNFTGFIALLTGCSSVIGVVLSDNDENENLEIVLGIFSCVLGTLFITRFFYGKDLSVLFFVSYMLINSIYLFINTWKLKSIINWWWLYLFFFGIHIFPLHIYNYGFVIGH